MVGSRDVNWVGNSCADGKGLDIMKHDIHTVTLAAATTGAVASKELFTVTGLIMACVVGKCTTDVTMTGAGATLALGNETVTNQFIAATAGDAIDAGEIWLSNTPATSYVSSDTVPIWSLINGLDVGYTIGVDSLSGGVVEFHLFWYPISEDASVSVAGVDVAL